jgi:hypothetical protein
MAPTERLRTKPQKGCDMTARASGTGEREVLGDLRVGGIQPIRKKKSLHSQETKTGRFGHERPGPAPQGEGAVEALEASLMVTKHQMGDRQWKQDLEHLMDEFGVLGQGQPRLEDGDRGPGFAPQNVDKPKKASGNRAT